MGKNAKNRRKERRLRRADRRNARTERVQARQETRQTAYEQGFEPNSGLTSFVETAGGIVSGVIAGKNASTASDATGRTKSEDDGDKSSFEEWFEDNKSLVLGAGGLLIGTKLLKLW